MKEKIFISVIGGFTMIIASIPMYNYYLLPVIRHKEIINKIENFDERLKKLEK
jgi:hypothetical protein